MADNKFRVIMFTHEVDPRTRSNGWKTQTFSSYKEADTFLGHMSEVMSFGNKESLITGGHIEEYISQRLGWVIAAEEKD